LGTAGLGIDCILGVWCFMFKMGMGFIYTICYCYGQFSFYLKPEQIYLCPVDQNCQGILIIINWIIKSALLYVLVYLIVSVL